jgi:hypothetical protein
MSRRKRLPPTHRPKKGPDFANSSRFHSATPSQIAEDRLPRRRERVSFRQVPSAGRPRIRALAKLPPSQRPQISPTSAAPGKPLALRLPAARQATAPVSPGRHKSEKRGAATRQGPATLISFAPAWHKECKTVTFAQQRFAVTVRPGAREPGKPPCHRVPAVRHEGPDAASQKISSTRANMS